VKGWGWSRCWRDEWTVVRCQVSRGGAGFWALEQSSRSSTAVSVWLNSVSGRFLSVPHPITFSAISSKSSLQFYCTVYVSIYMSFHPFHFPSMISDCGSASDLDSEDLGSDSTYVI